MKVTTVSANIKYSQDTGKGAWKAVELGAEATVDPKDSWQLAQHQLYGELSQDRCPRRRPHPLRGGVVLRFSYARASRRPPSKVTVA